MAEPNRWVVAVAAGGIYGIWRNPEVAERFAAHLCAAGRPAAACLVLDPVGELLDELEDPGRRSESP